MPAKIAGRGGVHAGVVRDRDPRYQPVVDEIAALYQQANGVRCPWGPAQGRNLNIALREMRGWSLDRVLGCVRNRFKSAKNHAENPVAWVRFLSNYAGGPLNKFGDVMDVAETDCEYSEKYSKQNQQLTPQNANPLPEGREITAQIQAVLGLTINPHSYETWVKPCRFFAGDEDGMQVWGPTPDHRRACMMTYRAQLKAAWDLWQEQQEVQR